MHHVKKLESLYIEGQTQHVINLKLLRKEINTTGIEGNTWHYGLKLICNPKNVFHKGIITTCNKVNTLHKQINTAGDEGKTEHHGRNTITLKGWYFA